MPLANRQQLQFVQPEKQSPPVTAQHRQQAPLFCRQHNNQAFELLLIACRFVIRRLVLRGLCHRKQLHPPLDRQVDGAPNLTLPSRFGYFESA